MLYVNISYLLTSKIKYQQLQLLKIIQSFVTFSFTFHNRIKCLFNICILFSSTGFGIDEFPPTPQLQVPILFMINIFFNILSNHFSFNCWIIIIIKYFKITFFNMINISYITNIYFLENKMVHVLIVHLLLLYDFHICGISKSMNKIPWYITCNLTNNM